MSETTPSPRMVSVYGVMFNPGGWPSDIPFRDLNRVQGGTKALKKLQELVDKGDLKLVRATEQDKLDAQRDPRLVIPNTRERDATLTTPAAQPGKKLMHRITDLASRFELPLTPGPLPTGTVLHPLTLDPQFTFSALPTTTADAPDASAVSDRPRHRRAQRSDIKKHRFRPVTNPEGRKLRHPRRGPTTARYVVEASGIRADEVGQAIRDQRIIFANEDLEDCVELASRAGTAGGWDLRAAGELSSDIESAGEWDREMVA